MVSDAPTDYGRYAFSLLFKDLSGDLDVFEGIGQVGPVKEEVFFISAGLLDFEEYSC